MIDTHVGRLRDMSMTISCAIPSSKLVPCKEKEDNGTRCSWREYVEYRRHAKQHLFYLESRILVEVGDLDNLELVRSRLPFTAICICRRRPHFVPAPGSYLRKRLSHSTDSRWRIHGILQAWLSLMTMPSRLPYIWTATNNLLVHLLPCS